LIEEVFIINTFSFYSSGIFTIGCYLNEVGTECLLNLKAKEESKHFLENLAINIIPDLGRAKHDFISKTANRDSTTEIMSTNASEVWKTLQDGNFKKLYNSSLDLGGENVSILHFITPFDEKLRSQIINGMLSEYNSAIIQSQDKICIFVSPCSNSQFMHLPGNNRIGRVFISSFLQNYPSPNTGEMTASFEMIKWINMFVFYRALKFSNNSMQAQIINTNFTNVNIFPKSYKEQINTYQLYLNSVQKNRGLINDYNLIIMFGQNYGLTQCYNYFKEKERDKYIPLFNNVGSAQLLVLESFENMIDDVFRRNIVSDTKRTSQELIKNEQLISSYLSELTNFSSLLNNNKIQKLITFLTIISVFLGILSLWATIYSSEVREYLKTVFNK